jgi:hypothetical protein
MGGGTITRTFESAGERQVSLTGTDDAGATQTATTNVTVSPSTAPTVGLTPTETRAPVDGTTTFDITLSGASAGVSAYDLNVSVGNTSVATIAAGTVTNQFSPTVPGGQSAPDGSAVRLVAESGALSDTGSVTLGNVSLSSVAPGTTEVNITVESVSGASGVAYESPAITGATITIDGSAGDPSPVVGSATPTDVDADGQYEDINGDGTFDIVDVSAFFNHFTDDTVQNQTPEAFDFNDDGSVNIVDVNRLFEAIA